MRVLGIIPARYESSRFPGKPLALIGDKAMLRHVYDNVMVSGLFENVIIATDDKRIFEAARSWNADVVMTSSAHPSGTDRIAEAAKSIEEEYDVIINIQGDEPFILAEPLRQLISLFNEENVEIGTLVGELRENEVESPDIVKAVLDVKGKALYFSRAAIPFVRDKYKLTGTAFLKHIGIYGYRRAVLEQIVRLPPSSLELAESLEQLRWLENGFNIFAVKTNYRLLAVDTPEDLIKAENFLKNSNNRA
jgi:3-deoxy-manno-octulosonate cytidylyltransferase (CMP-KDO synthetase)